MARILSALALGALLSLPGAAGAVPLPVSGAHAEATASAPGATPAPVVNDDPAMAIASVSAPGSDNADADAEATVGGALRSRSAVEGASGAQGPSEATSLARWTSGVLVAGGGGAVDVDLRLDLDGSLAYFQNNANPGLDDVYAQVGARVVVHDTLGATTVFDGTVRLGTGASGAGLLARSGGWADASRDGDFAGLVCGQFACNLALDVGIDFDDALFVTAGQTFAVEVELGTAAFMFNGFEIEATSDFLNTASLTLGSDTPGVTFELVSVPEPALLLLLLPGVPAALRRARG